MPSFFLRVRGKGGAGDTVHMVERHLGLYKHRNPVLSTSQQARLGMLSSCPACWQRQLMDLVTDSAEEMNGAIVHLV
jgi:hypothetical protein